MQFKCWLSVFLKMTTKVADFGKAPKMKSCRGGKLVKSMDEIAFCFQLIGIPIDHQIGKIGSRTKLLRYWSIGFGWVSLFINITLSLWSLAIIEKPKTTADWNDLITTVNYAFVMTMAQAGLLILVAPQWNFFLKMLHRIDHHLSLFQSQEYNAFKKIWLIGCFSFIFMVRYDIQL